MDCPPSKLVLLAHMAKKISWLLEDIGWYGPVAIIIAFTLVSFGVIEARSYLFQILNLTGALSIIAISLAKKVYQSVVLNVFFVVVSVIVIVQLLFS